MNARPDPLQSFGTPPQQTAMSRAARLLRTLSVGGGVAAVALLAAQAILPEHWKPSWLAGEAAGTAEVGDIAKKQDYAAGYAAAMAEAQAQAQARSAIEIETNRQQQQTLADSLQGQVTIANLADWSCLGGGIIAALGAQKTGQDWQNVGHAMQSGCGAGAAIRQHITEEQAQAGRTGGAVMTRNTYGQSAAPLSPPGPGAAAR